MTGVRIRAAHTAQLSAQELRAARGLLDAAFAGHPDGEFTDADWEHTVGGMHVTAWEGERLVAHASEVQRRLLHGGRALRTGYVEGVAVAGDRRGRRYGAAVMAEIERLITGAYQLGALGSTEEAVGFYTARGWRAWPGPTCVLTPDKGVRRTQEADGWVFVLPVPGISLDPSAALVCDWRDGDEW